jgi:hypothetical protein
LPREPGVLTTATHPVVKIPMARITIDLFMDWPPGCLIVLR